MYDVCLRIGDSCLGYYGQIVVAYTVDEICWINRNDVHDVNDKFIFIYLFKMYGNLYLNKSYNFHCCSEKKWNFVYVYKDYNFEWD